ncbi:MAG: hypothetical protein ABDK94_03725 [Atribacterota bacterium]
MTTLVFFGATGHLFTKKIFPALASFSSEDFENLSILAIGRRFTTPDEYANFLSGLHPNAGEILKRIQYLKADAKEEDLVPKLTAHLSTQEVLFYLATLPSIYPDILKQIHRWRTQNPAVSTRIALEKPFGQDETGFTVLEKELRKTFAEEDIFYVDHYLGKSTVLGLIILKAENLFMEKLLSREHLQEVRIAVCETEGVEEREKFYEETGAIRDIFQNHILQLLTLFAIDIPPLCEEDKRECQRFQQKVAEEKVRLLEMVRLPEAQDIFLGQYEGYRQEAHNPHSHTETLLSIPLFIDSPRWHSVPFRILTGKKMAERRSFIEAIFHSVMPSPNRLSIEIQPEERIDLFINVKTPSMDLSSTMAKLNFNYFGTFGAKSPEAYQKILYDFIRHDRTLFPNSQFIRQSWKITDELRQKIEQYNRIPIPYPPHVLRAEDFFIRHRFGRNPQ